MLMAVSVLEKIIGGTSLALCLFAGVMRLIGYYHVMGIETITLFIVGMGGLLTAVYLRLYLTSP